MPHFQYKAFDRSGREISGQIDAASREAALRLLSEQGHFPVEAVEHASSLPANTVWPWPFSGRLRSGEVTLFTRELALLLAAGHPLSDALSLIGHDSKAHRVQAVVWRLRAAIAQGKSFFEALDSEGRTFPPVYVGMVKAAEASGQLSSVLNRIADARESEQRLKAKITSALLYPILLVVMSVGAIMLLMIVVLPRFKEMLGDQALKLPASSRAVLMASEWLVTNGERLSIGLGLGLIILLVLGRSPRGQRLHERLWFGMPLVGDLLRMSLTARFCRTLGVLLASGLGLPAALALTKDAIANTRARTLIDNIGVALRQGKDFTEPLAQSSVLPSMVTSVLRIGAESGSLPSSALRLADMYEAKLEIAMHRLVTVLEPAIILAVSIFIGFIVLSIMGAIVGVYDLAD